MDGHSTENKNPREGAIRSPDAASADPARQLARITAELRGTILDMIGRAKLGHVGGDFSVIDILATLYFDVLRLDPARPDWPERDRLILSKGHCSAALYAVLARRGFFPLPSWKPLWLPWRG